MEQFIAIIPMVLRAFWQMLVNPIFWVVVIFVAFQYKRFSRMKEDLFGVKGEPIWQHTFLAVGHGIVGGLIGSFLMVLVGISLTDIGIGYLWVLAVLLMFISPRFLCFSYSGGIISLSFLLFGWPRVDVPQLIGLVAVLHMVEGLLILFSGHLGAVPIYTRAGNGQVVGAFNLQKFWPIPIVGMLMLPAPLLHTVTGSVSMPEWWPLIKPAAAVDLENAFYLILPVVAALGYGDLAITSVPQDKSKRSAVNLTGYSVLLLLLAIAASHYPVLAVAAALFSAFGHEYVIKLGRQAEMKGRPLYVPSDRGLRILDVLRGTPAANIGLRSGDIILKINNMEIKDRQDLSLALMSESSRLLEVEYVTLREKYVRRQVEKRPDQPFGTIPVPQQYDRPQVEVKHSGLLLRLFRRLRRS